MKVLMVSIPSLHFFRWAEQLEDSGIDVYWFDVTGMAEPSPRLFWAHQKTGWKLKWDYPGRTFLKRSVPGLYRGIQKLNEYSVETVFEDYLKKVQPDVVHSFALYVACTPILKVMRQHTGLPWVYSSWGSDLFYYQHDAEHLKDIKRVLSRLDYMFADCERDYTIAKQYGFRGVFLGVYPGGGGFKLNEMQGSYVPIEERKVILIKGFQGRSGRAITVLKALEGLQAQLKAYNIVVFGAPEEVKMYVEQSTLHAWENLRVTGRIDHEAVLQLMGRALIYIGNSNSDGIPNTLLEAICMGALPIQSNPGGASAEVITHGVNGFLITDCESVFEIQNYITAALDDENLLKTSFEINMDLKNRFDFTTIKTQVLNKYFSLVE